MEQDTARLALYRQLLEVPHREITPMVIALRGALEEDPLFISRACVYLTQTTQIRDQADAALVTLLQARDGAFRAYREAGRCLLLGDDFYDIEQDGISGLPPFRIMRVERYIASPFTLDAADGTVLQRHVSAKAAQNAMVSLAKHLKQTNPDGLRIHRDYGHSRVSTLMRSVMTDWVRGLEREPARFDGVVIRLRKPLKSIYRRHHIAPSARAQAILFDNDPPTDSKLGALRQVARSGDPELWLQLVEKHKLPYTALTSVLPNTTAAKIVMVQSMSPREAANNRARLEREGLLAVPEIFEVWSAKVAQSTGSAASLRHRQSTQGTDERVQAVIDAAVEKSVAEEAEIERKTLLLVDRSGSMEGAIQVAKKLAARIAPRCTAGLMIVAFNTEACEIKPRGTTLRHMDMAFAELRAMGGTAMGAGLQYAIAHNFFPEQVVIVTDGGELHGVRYTEVLKRLNMFDTPPQTVVVRVPGDPNWLTQRLDAENLPNEMFEVRGDDYYAFDQIVAVLGGPPAMTLVQRILECELPHRKGHDYV